MSRSHRSRRGWTSRALAASSLLLATAGIAACFSDRSTSAAPDIATCSAPSSTAGATIVFIRSFTFIPAQVHVKSGGSVAWVNCEPDNTPHTSTGNGGAWDSGNLAPGGAFVKSFAATGSFPYFCAYHAGMKATVIVE
jgi:plastocyanin